MTFENCIVNDLFYFFRKKSLKVTLKKLHAKTKMKREPSVRQQNCQAGVSLLSSRCGRSRDPN